LADLFESPLRAWLDAGIFGIMSSLVERVTRLLPSIPGMV